MQNLEFLIKLNDMLSPAMAQAAKLTDNEAAKIVRDFEKIHSAIDRVGEKTQKLGGFFKTAFAFAGGNMIANAFMNTGEWIKQGMEKAEAKHQAIAQVNASLASTKGAAGLNFGDVEKEAQRISDASEYGKTQILKMQSVLLTFPDVTKKTFGTASQAITDMSAKLGQDLQSSSIQVGKALQDPEKGVVALHRVGVNFSTAQIESIKKLVAAGDKQGAQTKILAELNKEFGGSAKAAYDANPLIKFQKTMNTIQTAIGGVVLALVGHLASAFNAVAHAVMAVVHWFREHKVIMLIVGGIIGVVVASLIVYETWLGLVSIKTSLLAAKQWILNSALFANPIVWVIMGIIALIAIIGGLIIGIKGWGDAWHHVVTGSKLIFQGFVEAVKWYWNSAIDGIMIGLDYIMQGWYKFKSAVGMGVDSENQAMLGGLSNDINKREDNIKNGALKTAATIAQGGNEFLLAGKSLSIDHESIAKVKNGLKNALGLGEHKDPLTANIPTGAGGAAGDGADGKDKKEKHTKANAINSGGQRSIVINITKVIDKLDQHIVGGTKEAASEIGTAVREELRRVLYSLNGAVTS